MPWHQYQYSRGLHSTPARAAASQSSATLDANFVRFKLTRPEAEAAYAKWASSFYLSPSSIRDVRVVDETYVPFYVFDVTVQSRFGGRVGYRRMVPVLNPATRKLEMRSELEWSSVRMDSVPQVSHYGSDLANLQIYGAFKLKWAPIQIVKTPLPQKSILTPAMMNPQDFRGKEVDVFEMKIEVRHHRRVFVL
jgi:hypothetical protein